MIIQIDKVCRDSASTRKTCGYVEPTLKPTSFSFPFVSRVFGMLDVGCEDSLKSQVRNMAHMVELGDTGMG